MTKTKLYDKDGKYVKSARLHPSNQELMRSNGSHWLAIKIVNSQGLFTKSQLGAK